MAVIRKRHVKGLNLDPTDISLEPLDKKGDLAYDSSDDSLKYKREESFTVQENSTADTLELNNHSFQNDDKIVYSGTEYFVINTNQNDFQLSTVSGGVALDITTDTSVSIILKGSRKVLDTLSQDTLENKTIDATAATGNNTLSMDSSDAVYDDAVNAVSSLGTNVQDALDAIKTALDNQNDASEINYAVAQASDYDVQPAFVKPALDELAARVRINEGDITTNSGALSDHLVDAVDAHDASAISNVPSGNLAATDIQSAVNELQSDIDTRALADSGTISNATITTPAQLDVKQDTEANLVTYASTATDGQIVFATDSQKMFQVIGNSLEPIGGGGSTQFEINQVAHGFSVGDGIYHDGTTWVKAQANDAATLAYHVVVQGSETDVNLFIAADFGRIIDVPLGDNSTYSLVAGQYYFLSDSVAGQPTSTEPSTFSNPLFYVESIDSSNPSAQLAILQLKCLRPEQVGANTNLDDLSDVTASTASEGDVIKYDGSVWQAEKQDEVVISLVAAETIAARDAIYVNASGQAALVDPDDDLKIEFIGFAREAANVAESVEIVIAGKLGGFSGLTAGEFVYVDPTTPGAVVQPEPTQSNVYLIKAGKAVSATEILVNADLGASTLFNRDVVISNQTITNNQTTPANITGAVYDGASFRAVILEYSIYRKTDTNEVSQVGQLRLAYKTDAGTWSLSDDFSGDDAGVEFSVDGTGQILYTSSDLTGTNYTSKLQIDTRQLFEV